MILRQLCTFLFVLQPLFSKGVREPNQYMQSDILSPFTKDSVEVRRKNRLSHKHYEVVNTHQNATAYYSINSFIHTIGTNTITGHRILVSNGFKMLSVLEPQETRGCTKHKTATVLESSKQRNCIAAMSAGFFNDQTGQCYGNVVSDGEIVNQFRGLKSANFGIRNDGSLVIGYLKETDIVEMQHPMLQMVSGIGWILRNGDNYLTESFQHEQCNLDNLKRFFETRSARTFIGHDIQGQAQIIQVEGQTDSYGCVSISMLKVFLILCFIAIFWVQYLK